MSVSAVLAPSFKQPWGSAYYNKVSVGSLVSMGGTRRAKRNRAARTEGFTRPSRHRRDHDTAPPSDERLVLFQNVPAHRSLPTIAHSHVFFRLREGTHQLETTLEMLRARWEACGGASQIGSATWLEK